MTWPAPTWKARSERASMYLGDCLEVLPRLPDHSVDAIVTDPPYSSGGQFRSDRVQSTSTKYQSSAAQTVHANFSGDNRDQLSFAWWATLWLIQCHRIAKPGAMLLVFTDWRQLPLLSNVVQAAGWVWRGVIVWDKITSRPTPNRFRQQAEFVVWCTNGARNADPENARYGDGVFRVGTPPTKDRVHATQKPVRLMEDLIEVAADVGELVLDPFMGSGTTGVAAIGKNRTFCGIEKDPVWFNTSAGRICEANRLADGGPLFAEADQPPLITRMGGAA